MAPNPVHLPERCPLSCPSVSGKVKLLVIQSFLTLCDPMVCSPPGCSVHGILQARILEWVAIPFSGDLPDPWIKPRSCALQVDSLPSELPEKPTGEDRSMRAVLGKVLPVRPVNARIQPEWQICSYSKESIMPFFFP